VFTDKYIGQNPTNFYFTLLNKKSEKAEEVLKMTFKKEYNKVFSKNDLDFPKILNLSIQTLTQNRNSHFFH
jgi:hypothetical protein